MFLFLVGVLAVSIAGLVVLLGFKHAELRTGKTLFSPVWLKNKDVAIETAAQQAMKKTRRECARCGRASWRFLCTCRDRIPAGLKAIRAKRFAKKKVEPNGGGSVYLKQAIEHKNNVRNGDNIDSPE